MIAVVETVEFLAEVKVILSDDEHDELVLYMANHPEAGTLIPETGGLRKLRWSAKGKGKRAGSRVIYYFHNLEVPLYLMAIYAKSVQSDLTPNGRKLLVKQLNVLKAGWKTRGSK